MVLLPYIGRLDSRALSARAANAMESLAKQSNSELARLATQYRQRLANPGQRIDVRYWQSRSSTLVQCVALIGESVRRALGKIYYAVQIQGGIELALGRIAQMQTGEGKTLTTAIPAFIHALVSGSVHVATTNFYLAHRDCEELRPALELLGLTVGLLPEEHNPEQARQAYQCDITFGTGYDFGFDFLRDQITLRGQRALPLGREHLQILGGRVSAEQPPIQRCRAFAVIDEADSVLIDEATMPLILSSSSPTSADPEVYRLAAKTVVGLTSGTDYELDPIKKTITLTDAGREKSFEVLREQSALPLKRHWEVYIKNAIRAAEIYQRDVDYVVIDDAVQIVDQHTGRIHAERTWRDGLHQAVETKEQVAVTSETSSNAKITRQRYFERYHGMCGMTGTAVGVEAELKNFYGLNTSIIGTNKPCIRQHLPLRSFVDCQSRDAAIVDEILEVRKTGRPVLIGTRTIRHSRELSLRLTAAGVSHTVLNGLQDQAEADIVSRAGRKHAVTIATNMAGRGTDIRLDRDVCQLGGLHVVGAEPNLSARVDRQLQGRAARQGNPGSCRFFVAASDELIGYDQRTRQNMLESSDERGECRREFENEIKTIQHQRDVEGFETRRAMVSRDHWLDEILKTLAGRGTQTC